MITSAVADLITQAGQQAHRALQIFFGGPGVNGAGQLNPTLTKVYFTLASRSVQVSWRYSGRSLNVRASQRSSRTRQQPRSVADCVRLDRRQW